MNDLDQRVAERIAAGETIEAIKLLRQATGASLAEAKDEVERRARGEAPWSRATRAEPTAIDPDIVDLAREGRSIEAIKLLRERAGLGLAEAKQRIDALDVGKPRRGCALVLLALVACSAAVGARAVHRIPAGDALSGRVDAAIDVSASAPATDALRPTS